MSDSPSSHRAAIAVEIRPGVGMLALLSSMNYKPWYALSEFVDNALASFKRTPRTSLFRPTSSPRVTVTIRFERDPGRIEIVDDAAGIAAAEWPVRSARRPPPGDRVSAVRDRHEERLMLVRQTLQR